ncbi:hypothetical protein ACEQ8H_006832 [Pleosporales sp. CAS-2024a]
MFLKPNIDILKKPWAIVLHTFGEYSNPVRKGQEIQYSAYTMHWHKEIWGEDADEFRPDRWYGRRPGWEYLPLNGGPRICVGQQFALKNARYVLVNLLQRFEDTADGVKSRKGENRRS